MYNVLGLPGSLCKHQRHVTINSSNFVEQKVVTKTHVISQLIIISFSTMLIIEIVWRKLLSAIYGAIASSFNELDILV